MAPERPTNIDSPTINDRLGFKAYADGITAAIVDATVRNQLPLTIGIYGRWGSGKTSLMKMVEAALQPGGDAAPKTDEQKEQIRKWRTRLQWWLGIVVVLVVAGFLATPFVARRVAESYPRFAPTALFAGFFCAFAALGAWARAGFECWWRGSVLEKLDDGALAWIAARPVLAFMGAAVAMLALYDVMLFRELALRSIWVLASSYVGAFAFCAFAEEVCQLPIWAVRRLRWRKMEERKTNGTTAPEFQVIWFNAWKYTEEKELWATLLQRLLNELKVNAAGKKRLLIKWQLWKRSVEWKSGAWDVAKKLTPTVGKALVAAVTGVATAWLANLALANSGGGALSGKAAGPAVGVVSGLATLAGLLRKSVLTPLADIDFDKYRKKESFTDRVAFFTEFSEELKAVTEISRGAGNPVVVMLDDLDRCLPERAVSVLEAIKLFVGESAQVVFLIGADREFVERAVDVMYAKLKEGADVSPAMKERFDQLGHEYLEKIVQLPFNLPPIDVPQIDTFIDTTFPNDTVVTTQKHIFAAGLLANPRQVVRAVGTYRFIVGLAEQKNLRYTKVIDDSLLAKVVVVQYRWPELYADVVEHPELLWLIEAAFRNNAVDLPGYEVTWSRIQASTGKRALQAMLTLAPTLSGVNLAPYLFFTSRSQTTPSTASTSGATIPSSAATVTPPAPTAAAPTNAPVTTSVAEATPPPAQAVAAAAGAGTGTAMPLQAPVAPTTPAPATVRMEEVSQRGPSSLPGGSEMNASIQALGATFLQSQLTELSGRIDALKQKGADSALVSQLLEKQSRIGSYLASNALEESRALLEDAKSLTASLEQKLQQQENVANTFEDVQLGTDGALITHRAVSYNALDLYLTEAQGAMRYSLVDRGRELVTSTGQGISPALNVELNGFLNGYGVNLDLLGSGLRDMFGPLLTSALDSRNSNRVRVHANSVNLENPPWEAMLLGGTDAIGLDPKHCMVRGISEQTGPTAKTTFPINVLLTGFSGSPMLPPQRVQNILGELNAAFRPLAARDVVRTRVLQDPNFDEFRSALRDEGTQILHVVSGDGFNAMPAGAVQLPIGMVPSPDSYSVRFGELLKDARVLVLVLEIPFSRPAARDWAAFVPVTIGLQNNQIPADASFGLAFYRALLRTGQADFALTEGRRAVYSAAMKFFANQSSINPPIDPNQTAKLGALAYCSYQSAGAGALFEAAPGTSSRKFK